MPIPFVALAPLPLCLMVIVWAGMINLLDIHLDYEENHVL